MKIPWSDKYKPFSQAQEEESIKAKQRAEEHRAELKRIGSSCLSDSKFQKYKEIFHALERLTFDQVRHYKNPDPVQYAIVVSNMLTELNTFQALITDVEIDALRRDK